ncbi:NCS1 family transporter [Niallia sp. Krafla_26]|uniref:NCS1 family transporter n=1 Tax=Niallia sp. Krafla_26 TaxID=3064703 RepID=UPI003D174D12
MQKRNNLIKKDNIPIAFAGRNVGLLGYSFVWVGIAVIIATFALGGDGVQDMKLGWVLLACLLANIVLGAFISITGDIGIEHGINFPVYMRAPFGVIGSYIPMLIRAVLGAFWFGIQTYFGALAINYIFMNFFGFDNWLFWYIVFTIAQVINTAFGFKAIERFSSIAAPCIIIISVWMYFRLEGVASAAGNNVWNTVLGSESSGFVWNTFIILFFVNMAFWSTAASDSQNLTRYVKTQQFEKSWFKRNKNTLLGHLVALPLTQSAMIVIGGVAMIAVNNWNPVEAIQSTASGIILIVLLVMVVFAQWSTNAASNLLTPATVFAEVFPKIGYVGGVILTAIVGSVIQPWALMEVLTDFLNVMSSVYSAIVGILFSDYYLLRKRRLNIPELYKKNGQFAYAHGWNLAGIISLILGMAVASVFSSYAFLVGFVVSFIAYYFLAKKWWFIKYKQAEIEENYPDRLLGVTNGTDWVLNEEQNAIVPSFNRNRTTLDKKGIGSSITPHHIEDV